MPLPASPDACDQRVTTTWVPTSTRANRFGDVLRRSWDSSTLRACPACNLVRVRQPQQRTVAAIEVILLFALRRSPHRSAAALRLPSGSAERGTMANVHPIASTKDTGAEFARFA